MVVREQAHHRCHFPGTVVLGIIRGHFYGIVKHIPVGVVVDCGFPTTFHGALSCGRKIARCFRLTGQAVILATGSTFIVDVVVLVVVVHWSSINAGVLLLDTGVIDSLVRVGIAQWNGDITTIRGHIWQFVHQLTRFWLLYHRTGESTVKTNWLL